MEHENHAFIEELFFKQARRITRSPMDTFEVQFGDAWMQG